LVNNPGKRREKKREARHGTSHRNELTGTEKRRNGPSPHGGHHIAVWPEGFPPGGHSNAGVIMFPRIGGVGHVQRQTWNGFLHEGEIKKNSSRHSAGQERGRCAAFSGKRVTVQHSGGKKIYSRTKLLPPSHAPAWKRKKFAPPKRKTPSSHTLEKKKRDNYKSSRRKVSLVGARLQSAVSVDLSQHTTEESALPHADGKREKKKKNNLHASRKMTERPVSQPPRDGVTQERREKPSRIA